MSQLSRRRNMHLTDVMSSKDQFYSKGSNPLQNKLKAFILNKRFSPNLEETTRSGEYSADLCLAKMLLTKKKLNFTKILLQTGSGFSVAGRRSTLVWHVITPFPQFYPYQTLV